MHKLESTSAPLTPFCTFRLDQRLYGIPVRFVREISLNLPMTAVPQAPATIRGLANLRSRIFLVLDLGPLLGLAPIAATSESRLIILKREIGQDMALLVERGEDIIQVRTEQIEPAAIATDSLGVSASSLIAGVCKLDGELMMIVDPTQLTETLLNQKRSTGIAPNTKTRETIP